MPIYAKCRTCGTTFESKLFDKFSGTLILEGNTQNCIVPGCIGTADIQDGHFGFVKGVLTAFASHNMTREKVEAFQRVIARANQGEITAEEATREAGSIDPALSRVVQHAQEKGINWDRIIALLALLHAIWVSYSSDAAVQAALAETQKQTELQQKMLEELQGPIVFGSGQSTKPEMRQLDPTGKTATKNRAERRTAAAIERRRKRRGE